PEVLEELLEMLAAAAPKAQMLWNNSQVINIFDPAQRDPWARVWTKKPGAIELALAGPKGKFALGRVAELGVEPEFDAGRAELDVVKLRFVTEDDLHRGDLQAFLEEHAESLAADEEDRPLLRRGALSTAE